MKRLLLIFSVLLALAPDAVYGNSFFRGFTGTWKVTNTTTLVSSTGSETLHYRFTARAKILRNGALYTYQTGKVDGKTSATKTWAYKNGRYRGVSFLGGRKIDEGDGRWKIDSSGRLSAFRDVEFNPGQMVRVRSLVRKVSKDKYIATTRAVDTRAGLTITSVNVLTRVRN